jgi:hypothetical protein
MSGVAFNEKIHAMKAEGGFVRKVPATFAKLAAAAEVTVPMFGTMPIQKVDQALAGLSIEDRLQLKCQLRELGIIN